VTIFRITPKLSVVAAAAATLALAACGEDREEGGDVKVEGSTTGKTESKTTATGPGTTTTASGPSVATVRVSETDFKLTPANPRISKAGVVTFVATNNGKAPHAIEVEGPNGEVETPTIQPGRSATIKVDLGKAGRYEWYCPVGNHRERGMRGEITVAGGGSARSDDDGRNRDDNDRGRTDGGGPGDDDSGGASAPGY
jgi:uncharacterized cupredoxin-like copper-binding protein